MTKADIVSKISDKSGIEKADILETEDIVLHYEAHANILPYRAFQC